MATGNDTDSDQSFNRFNSDDINDYHDKVNELNDSDLDISSIGSSDDDDEQSDIDISSVYLIVSLCFLNCHIDKTKEWMN